MLHLRGSAQLPTQVGLDRMLILVSSPPGVLVKLLLSTSTFCKFNIFPYASCSPRRRVVLYLKWRLLALAELCSWARSEIVLVSCNLLQSEYCAWFWILAKSWIVTKLFCYRLHDIITSFSVIDVPCVRRQQSLHRVPLLLVRHVTTWASVLYVDRSFSEPATRVQVRLSKLAQATHRS